MQLRSDQLLAKLTAKAQAYAQDGSRHYRCPACRIRTKLYALKDGRRKCSTCGTKFHPEKKSDAVRLRQYADLLFCFSHGFTAQEASRLTGYRYRLAAAIYDELRLLVAQQTLVPGKLALLTQVEQCDHATQESTFCRRCRGRFACMGRKSGDSPVFGVKMLSNRQVFIDPLPEEDAVFLIKQPKTKHQADDRYTAYAGFICRGKFHRFMDYPRTKDGAEQMWAWMSERLKKHHGIWKKNAGLYLKELEWKYNHRLLTPEEQAEALADLLPAHFLRGAERIDGITIDLGLPLTATSSR